MALESRPEGMQRINTPALAKAYIDERIEMLRACVEPLLRGLEFGASRASRLLEFLARLQHHRTRRDVRLFQLRADFLFGLFLAHPHLALDGLGVPAPEKSAQGVAYADASRDGKRVRQELLPLGGSAPVYRVKRENRCGQF